MDDRRVDFTTRSSRRRLPAPSGGKKGYFLPPPLSTLSAAAASIVDRVHAKGSRVIHKFNRARARYVPVIYKAICRNLLVRRSKCRSNAPVLHVSRNRVRCKVSARLSGLPPPPVIGSRLILNKAGRRAISRIENGSVIGSAIMLY